ncbi:hypothetical protein [Clostridium chrysemydis]|uniref:hypothetical protein n=1 Tax=Clostridium chrysemydis TaxID=2665504 RepID=UPI0018837FED|nr:hypothetical protein [Clostridium chrysemydis]
MKKIIAGVLILMVIFITFINFKEKGNGLRKDDLDVFKKEFKVIKTLNVNNYSKKKVKDKEAFTELEIMYFYPKEIKDKLKDNREDITFDNENIKVEKIDTLKKVETEKYILSSISINLNLLSEDLVSENINIVLKDGGSIDLNFGKLVNKDLNLSNLEEGDSKNIDIENSIIISKDDLSSLKVHNLKGDDITINNLILDSEYFNLKSDFKRENIKGNSEGRGYKLDISPKDKSYINFYYNILVSYNYKNKDYFYLSPIGTKEGLFFSDINDKILENSAL